jgi:hypothetical protein
MCEVGPKLNVPRLLQGSHLSGQMGPLWPAGRKGPERGFDHNQPLVRSFLSVHEQRWGLQASVHATASHFAQGPSGWLFIPVLREGKNSSLSDSE